jgi:hypothetical protein
MDPNALGDENIVDQSPSLSSKYLWAFAVLPTISYFAFDALLGRVTDFNIDPADRQVAILSLLLLKRVGIYSIALATVDLIAKRSQLLPASLGQVGISCLQTLHSYSQKASKISIYMPHLCDV